MNAYAQQSIVKQNNKPLFKGPHERVCSTQAELRQRIRKTVLHEIGHFFGFDDEYLHSHGY